jgi:hypothetical protein
MLANDGVNPLLKTTPPGSIRVVGSLVVGVGVTGGGGIFTLIYTPTLTLIVLILCSFTGKLISVKPVVTSCINV